MSACKFCHRYVKYFISILHGTVESLPNLSFPVFETVMSECTRMNPLVQLVCVDMPAKFGLQFIENTITELEMPKNCHLEPNLSYKMSIVKLKIRLWIWFFPHSHVTVIAIVYANQQKKSSTVISVRIRVDKIMTVLIVMVHFDFVEMDVKVIKSTPFARFQPATPASSRQCDF